MIEGVVTASPDGAGVAEVSVSNGREVVQTDPKGRYELERRPEDRFVFVTVPSGYDSENGFYREIEDAERHDFVVRPNPASAESEFSFVQITDIHMSVDGRRSNDTDLKEDLAVVCDQTGDRAAFIVATGDLTNRGEKAEYDAFLRGIEDCSLPLLTCIGNHDDLEPEILGGNYEDALGPIYYSFDYGHVHFVAYDCVGNKWREPDHQEAWIRSDLSLLPPGSPVVILNHYPLGNRFYDAFNDHNIIATFSGHWHCARVYEKAATVHYNSPPFCFGGIDQSPRAYRLNTVKDGALTSEIRAFDARPFAGASFSPKTRGSEVSTESVAARPDSDWPMFRGSPARTGRSEADVDLPLSPAWTASSGGGLHQGSPIIVGDSLVVGTQNEDRPNAAGLVALDAANGERRWDYGTSSSIKLSPAASSNHFYAATMTGEVVSLSEDGELRWSYQLGDASERWVYSSPLIWKNRVYVGAAPHFVSLDEASGDVVWLREDLGHQDWIASYPSPAGYEQFLVLAFHGQPWNLAVLDADTGKTIWMLEEPKSHRTNTTPVVDADGTIFIEGGTTLVRAFDAATGDLKWSSPLEKTRSAASLALSDGRLFVPDGDGMLTALDAETGEKIWEWQSGEGLGSFSPYVRRKRGYLVAGGDRALRVSRVRGRASLRPGCSIRQDGLVARPRCAHSVFARDIGRWPLDRLV